MAERDAIAKEGNDDAWDDLVVSILSVNQYSLESTYRFIGGLREQEVFNPSRLMLWGQGEIVERLRAAGCDRGSFMTNLFALRLAHLGALIGSRGLDVCAKIISGSDTKAIEDLLLPVNGIGPKVISNFCLLRGLPRK